MLTPNPSNQMPPVHRREPGLVEYALILALVAVVVIGVLVVLAPAITSIIRTFQAGL